MGNGATPAAWYADPSGQPLLRWWDGGQWAQPTVPFPPPGAPAPPPPSLWGTPAKPDGGGRHQLFRGKHQHEEEIARLKQIIDSIGITERDQLLAELSGLRQELPNLRQERDALSGGLPALRAETAGLQTARDELRSAKAERGQVQAEQVRVAIDIEHAERFRNERNELELELAKLRAEIIETRDIEILQEVGIYQYRHPLDDAIAYLPVLVLEALQFGEQRHGPPGRGGAAPCDQPAMPFLMRHTVDGWKIRRPFFPDGPA